MNWFKFKCSKNICSTKAQIKKPLKFSEKINNFIFHNKFSEIVFFLMIILIFEFTFKIWGLIADYIDQIGGLIISNLHSYNIFLTSTISAIFGLLMYLPNIIILYFFLYLLNDSGILTAYSVKFDKFLNKLWISWHWFLSMSLGFGCTVPAILSTKNLPTKEKIIVIMSLPFIPCSAKLPIFVLLISLFVTKSFQSLALLGVYLLSIIFSIISLKIISSILYYKPCIKTRLVTYKIPSIKQIFVKILEVLKEFIFKIWIFVIPITIGLTLLFKLPNWDIQTSYWKQIWEKISVIFQPLGFNEKMSISIFPGIIWKELIVSTLSNLYAIENPHNTSLIKEHLQQDSNINFKNTISFLIFILLYTTCIGSIITAFRQLGWKFGLLFAIIPSIVAYLVSLIIYQAFILF